MIEDLPKPKKKLKSIPIERILWFDAEDSNGWHFRDAEIYVPCMVETVGYVVFENDVLLVVAQTVCQDGWHNHRTKIPKVCIQKRKSIKV